jgi:hypothetical protein
VLLIEALLHRVAGGDQQRLAAASVHQTPSRLVDDVDERNIDSACYRIGDQVHGDGQIMTQSAPARSSHLATSPR